MQDPEMNRNTIRQHEKQRSNKQQKRHVDTVHEVSTYLQSEAVTISPEDWPRQVSAAETSCGAPREIHCTKQRYHFNYLESNEKRNVIDSTRGPCNQMTSYVYLFIN